MKTSHRVTLVVSLVAAASLLVSGTAFAAGMIVYDNIPTPKPDNVPSVGYEATSTSEFGGLVGFESGADHLQSATVLMSSWGCESGHWNNHDCSTTPGSGFTHTITLNIYGVGPSNSVGSLLTSATDDFFFPYRPSDDAACGYDGWGSDCVHGIAVPITFDLSASGIVLPGEAIIAVAYNTTHHGAAPIGTGASCYSSSGGCGYDSLNVGTADALSVGSQPAPADAYLDSTWSGAYCDGGTGGTGSLRLDAGCWTGYQPAFSVTASFPEPANADQCKDDGWMSLARADGSTFTNQGDCIQYVNTGK